MQRRTLLKLGVASAVALTLAGGAAALWRPAWQQGRLTPEGRTVFTAISRAVLDGLLPAAGAARDTVIASQLLRLEDTINGFPRPVQDELALLLALLASAPGRLGLAGLTTPWADATTAELQQTLQILRVSSLALRQQTYLALRDLSYGAYFADPASWGQTGYTGPTPFTNAPA